MIRDVVMIMVLVYGVVDAITYSDDKVHAGTTTLNVFLFQTTLISYCTAQGGSEKSRINF